MNLAREKLKNIEEATAKLESEMKAQNEQLDRLNLNLGNNESADFRGRGLDHSSKPEKSEEKSKEDIRVKKVLEENKALYGRIQRALTPKTGGTEEMPEKEHQGAGEQPLRRSRDNPVISKRISEALKTAANAIDQSKKIGFNPTVLKRPRK
jgi:hypothetical protein